MQMSETQTKPKKALNNVKQDGGDIWLVAPDGGEVSPEEFIRPSTLETDLIFTLAGRQIAAMLRVSSDPVALIAALKRGELPDRRRRARQPTEVERAVLAARAARAKKEGAEFDEDATLAAFRALSKAQKAAITTTVEVARELAKIRGKDAADPLAF
jgi:hypothetical protein